VALAMRCIQHKGTKTTKRNPDPGVVLYD